ncbi:DUF2513 domain-containing protein [Pseudochelatococcus sp. B33]
MSEAEVDVAIATALAKLAHVRGEGADMQRDMELVRAILKDVITSDSLRAREIKLDGYDPAIVGRHVEILFNAGYLEGVKSQVKGDPTPFMLVKDLTWEGHEFAGALLANDSVWQKVKAAFEPEVLRAMPLRLIQSVATDALKAWVLSQMGLK